MEEDNFDQPHVTIIKRQAPNIHGDCVIYRYGSFSTDIEIIGEIHSLTTYSYMMLYRTSLKNNVCLYPQRALRVCRSSRWQ